VGDHWAWLVVLFVVTILYQWVWYAVRTRYSPTAELFTWPVTAVGVVLVVGVLVITQGWDATWPTVRAFLVGGAAGLAFWLGRVATTVHKVTTR
jgi:hypothetical protein